MDAHDAALRERVCELCRHLYALGWASGTGGGFSLRDGDRIYVAPSGVQKERLRPEQIFVVDLEGRLLSAGQGVGLRISACTPLFLHAYRQRGAGAVLHSHSLNACLASVVFGRTFRVRGLEMMKGIEGAQADQVHEVPILDNTPHEHELADALAEAIATHPQSHAVLVRGHGAYIWGRDWVHAKTQAECYDYLFAAAVRLHELGLDPARLDRRLGHSGGEQGRQP
ncbi:MAG: methylthioribulose 1-phosphate dehydratase [Myxococcales bacterium]|nr:methylthioribulose 1-phosphate dehydratase [Myxococcota bacterium]MDW8280390.1 methylthioribulose 1-phosphate dehydratase [Myxococcales bacterium]